MEEGEIERGVGWFMLILRKKIIFAGHWKELQKTVQHLKTIGRE